MPLYIPNTTVNVINNIPVQHRHPGLQLDKYSDIGDGKQEAQKRALEKIAQTAIDREWFVGLLRIWRATIGTGYWQCKTNSSLTLHLSRSSALENAGICLHPIYGFVYLPGSGLKGMARAYAETVWLKDVNNREIDIDKNKKILEVFGNDPGEGKKQHVGNVIFHDAWPESCPKLIIDITNNHHGDYYNPPDKKGEYPPGDWEDPVPVYFLAIGPGNVFNFALSKRKSDVPDELVALAKSWLNGALFHLGAGAKTNAGYGAFVPVEGEKPTFPTTSNHSTFKCELELVTPAFLAGADQKAEDCDLRPATLRGLLRWWWRVLHIDKNTKDLRELEAELWGNTKKGGAIAIKVLTLSISKTIMPGKIIAKNRKGLDFLKSDEMFLRNNSIQIPPQTQPLFYAAYGTDEMPVGKRNERDTRWCALPGSKWELKIYTKERGEMTGKQVLNEAQRALALLIEHGGIGAKSRKGFGSLAIVNPSLELSSIKLENETEYDLKTNIYWLACERVGKVMMTFASENKHNPNKVLLGLPRKIHGPKNYPLQHQNPEKHKQPVELSIEEGPRLASPVWYHIYSKENSFKLRVTIIHPRIVQNNNKFYLELLNSIKNTCDGFDVVNKHFSDQEQNISTQHPKLSEQTKPKKKEDDEHEYLKQFKAMKPDSWSAQMPQLSSKIQALDANMRKDVSMKICKIIEGEKAQKKKNKDKPWMKMLEQWKQ